MALMDELAHGSVLLSTGEIHSVPTAVWTVAPDCRMSYGRPLEILRCDGAGGRFLIRSPACPDVLLID